MSRCQRIHFLLAPDRLKRYLGKNETLGRYKCPEFAGCRHGFPFVKETETEASQTDIQNFAQIKTFGSEIDENTISNFEPDELPAYFFFYSPTVTNLLQLHETRLTGIPPLL